MIELNHVSFTYAGGNEGIKDISLTIKDGECVVITGPSGGGKTTLTRLINGLAPSFYPGQLSGDIFINDKSIKDIPIWKIGTEIGSVFQDPKSQFFSSELAGEIAFALENYGYAQDEIRNRTDKAIDAFNLEVYRNRPLDLLSSGEKQRTAIAAVYAYSPHIYVCDEPTANLDNWGTEQLRETFQQLKLEGNTLIIAEHRLAWLANIADRFIYVDNGEILWELNPNQMNDFSDNDRFQLGLREIVNSKLKIPQLPCTLENPFLIIKKLGIKRGRKTILDNIDISLTHGQIVALTGKNGVGKTTLAMIISGLLQGNTGQITINGKNVSPSQRRKSIWYSSNDTGTQFFTNSVTDELLLGKNPSPTMLNKARQLLEQLGLYQYKDCHPAALSGGQKQRLSIACGIFSERNILILDEPTSGLDGGNMDIIANLLKAEANKGKTILVISHDIEWINRCCSYIYILN